MAAPTVRSSAAPGAKALLLSSGFYSLLRNVLPSRQFGILRYHAVCPRDAGYAEPGICVSPAAFEAQIAYLAAHYRVLSLPDAVATFTRGGSLPKNAVAITFDDGYADNLGAARILARHGLSATFYITAGCLADGLPFWPSELRGLLNRAVSPTIELDVDGTRTVFAVGTPAERRKTVSALTKLFKGRTIPARELLREQLRTAVGVSTVPSPMLTWDQVREMHAMGMTIGSHTMTHPNLPNAGVVDAEREVRESKARLESEIAAPVTMFSYPNGGADRYMTPAIADIVRKAGFAAATTSRNAFAHAGSDPFALSRIQVSEALEQVVFALEVERFVFKPKPRPGEVE